MIKKKVIERVFALILTKHRMWGTVLMPYILVRLEGNQYFSPEETLSPFASPETILSLTETENELINLINSYSDRYLFRLFSREKNVMEFLDRVTEERFIKHIRPYIESKLLSCFRIIEENNIPLYQQKTKTINLHREDLMSVSAVFGEPVFTFERNADSSYYQLQLFVEEREIVILNRDIEIICNHPCLIRYEDELIFINNLEGTKIKPFISKTRVTIPSQHSDTYFSGFVKTIVNSNRVIARGFEINNIDPDKRAQLIVEKGVKGIPVLILKFFYEEYEIFPASDQEGFTRFIKKGDTILFEKFYRDKVWEKNRHNTLLSLGFYTDDRISYSVVSSSSGNQEELYNLIEAVNNLYQELRTAGFTVKRGSTDGEYLLAQVSLTINYEIDNDWFDLNASVRIGSLTIPFVRFKKNIIDGNREYKLPDGKIFVLPEEWFTKYKNLFELGTSENNLLKIHKQHFALLNEAFSETECKSCPQLEKLVIPDKFPDAGTPSGLRATLRPYQIDGLNWMIFLQKNGLAGCLADDMGLGKTLQTLALIQHNFEERKRLFEQAETDTAKQNNNDPDSSATLIIVPASLVYNWVNEIARFTPEQKVYIYTGNQRVKSTEYFSDYDIVLSSYHTVRQDIDVLSEFKFQYIILDESQVIKNPASQLYKTVSRLSSNHRLVLTGTPVENSLTDLWTQLNFANKGLLGSLAYFKREFARPIEREQSEEKEVRLQKIIKPFILRRTKEEVARDLPPINEQTVYCDMTDEQQSLYEEEKSAIRNTLMGNSEILAAEKRAIIVLQGLMRLRQISNHPVLANSEYIDQSGKFEAVIHDVYNVIAEGHKILIFSSFVKHLELFAEHFAENGIKYAMLTGSSTNRGKIVDSFQDDPTCKIFLISLKAGGTGLNLTSADYVFILDPWWNPASEMQAMSRAHRIGQDKNVFVYKYLSTGSIEEKIVRLQEKKSKLAETFISSNNPLVDLNIDDMLELLA